MALIRSGGWLAGLLAVAALCACSPRGDDAPQPAPAPPAPPAQSAPILPVAPPALGRADLLSAVAEAASAFAAGAPPPKAVTDLADRRFSIRLPFGCLGPQPAAAAGYVYDQAKGSLKLTARPEQWTKVEAIRTLVGAPEAETIEGFWVARPWLRSDGCPAGVTPPATAEPAAPSAAEPILGPVPNTVGLVAVFEAGDSRFQQRAGRPYEVIRKTSSPPAPGGFRLVLEGRIVEGATGAVTCRGDHPDRPPTCLVRVVFERVGIESATGEQFGEWRS